MSSILESTEDVRTILHQQTFGGQIQERIKMNSRKRGFI